MKEATKEKHVYLAQLLCPDRHCVIAMANEYDSQEDAQRDLEPRMQNEFDGMVANNMINPRCGICESTRLRIEVRRTRFSNMKEARPTLEALSLVQAETARFVQRSRN